MQRQDALQNSQKRLQTYTRTGYTIICNFPPLLMLNQSLRIAGSTAKTLLQLKRQVNEENNTSTHSKNKLCENLSMVSRNVVKLKHIP